LGQFHDEFVEFEPVLGEFELSSHAAINMVLANTAKIGFIIDKLPVYYQ
jgi:hypothetical protein